MDDFSPEEEALFKRRLAAEQQAAQAQAMTHTVGTPTAAPSSTPQARMYDPATGTIGGEVNPLVRALMGYGAGVERSLASIGELAGVISPEKYREIQERGEMATRGPIGGTGEFLGEAAMATLAGGPVGRVARAAGPVVRGAIEGGVTSYATADPEKRKTEGAYGAVAAGALAAEQSRPGRLAFRTRGDGTARRAAPGPACRCRRYSQCGEPAGSSGQIDRRHPGDFG